MKLPQSQLNDADLAMLAIFDDSIYVVGGRPRDEFFAAQRNQTIKSKDNDYLVTGHTVDQVVDKLKAAGFKVNTVGASFAVTKAVKGDIEVEIAVPRRERSTGHGHKDVEIEVGSHISVLDDLLRRDITVNMIARRLKDEEIIAAPEAANDLEKRILRINSPNSILDDPLRIMRIIQFASRFEANIDPYTAEQMKKFGHLLDTVSGERKGEEMNKMMLKSRLPSVGWRIIRDYNLLQYISPVDIPAVGLEQNIYHTLDVFEHELSATDHMAEAIREGILEPIVAYGEFDKEILAKISMWGAKYHDVGKPITAQWKEGHGHSFLGHEIEGVPIVKKQLREFKFSELEVQAVAAVTRFHMYAHKQMMEANVNIHGNKSIRKWMSEINEHQPLGLKCGIAIQKGIRRADSSGKYADLEQGKTAWFNPNNTNHEFNKMIDEEMARKPALSIVDIDIKGQDLIKEFIEKKWENPEFKGGKSIGITMKKCLEAVVDDPGINTKESLLAFALQSASENFYINNAENIKVATNTQPSILVIPTKNNKAIAYVGNIPGDTEDGLVSGGFIRFEQNGKTKAEIRGMDSKRMASSLIKLGVTLEEAASVLATMESGIQESPKLEFEQNNYKIKVENIYEEKRTVYIYNKIENLEVKRDGIPNKQNTLELLGNSKDSHDIANKLMDIDLFGKRARDTIKRNLKNWPKKQEVCTTR